MSSTEGRARHAQSTTPCTLGLRGGGEKGTRAARTQYERAQKLRACSERRRALAPEVSAPHPGLQPAPAILHHFLLPPLLRTGRGQGRSGESHSRPSPPAGSVPEAQKWLPLKLALFPTAPRPRPHSKQIYACSTAVCVHVRTYTNACMHIIEHMHTRTSMRARMHACMHAYMHARTHTRTCAHTHLRHTHTHTHSHTHTHT